MFGIPSFNIHIVIDEEITTYLPNILLSPQLIARALLRASNLVLSSSFILLDEELKLLI